MENLPVIDVSGLRSSVLAERRAVAHLLGLACRNVGFFYVTGHGIPQSLRQNVFGAAKVFFETPEAEKERVSLLNSEHNRGYLGFGGERLNEYSTADHKESFNMGLELPPDDPELLGGARFRGPNQWPDLPGWRELMLEYYAACHQLEFQIHRGLALDLGLDEEFFTGKIDRPNAFVRLLRYPAGSADDGKGDLGAGEHTDYGNITLLTTNGVAGLQVRRRDGVWLDAPFIEDAYICNIGDCMMRWTNDVYISTPHRVTRPTADRYSLIFFMEPNPDAIVEAIPGCIAPGDSARYAPINAGDYLLSRLAVTYDHMNENREKQDA
jgi:isopenicillin N synthase-like dioxygenase